MFLMGYVAAPLLAFSISIVFGDLITAYFYLISLAVLLVSAFIYAGAGKKK